MEVFKAPSALEFLPSPAIPSREPLLNTYFTWFSLLSIHQLLHLGSSLIYSSKMVSMKIQSQPLRSFWISWGLWLNNIKDSGALKTDNIIKVDLKKTINPWSTAISFACLIKTNRSSEKNTWVSLFPYHNDYGDPAEYLILSGGTPLNRSCYSHHDYLFILGYFSCPLHRTTIAKNGHF